MKFRVAQPDRDAGEKLMKTILLAGLILALGYATVPRAATAAPMAQTKGDGPAGNSAPVAVPARPGPGDTTDRSAREPSTGAPARVKPDNKAECERAGGKWQPAQQKCDLGA
jgi:hypothetical protein